MSSFEYNDLLLKCQSTGKYHVFTFDIKDSKKMDEITRRKAQEKLFDLALLTYKTIEYKEKKDNKIILLKEGYEHDDRRIPKFGYTYVEPEPIIIGDLMYFTIYRDTLLENEVLEIFEECKKILNVDFEFHCANGYYETNDWCEGNTKYFRGYCIQTLSELHKPYNNKLRKLLKSKL